jgi:hypothetical protein
MTGAFLARFARSRHLSLITYHAFRIWVVPRLAIALALALPLSGCDYLPFGYTPVREIVQAPGQFEGKEVKVKGQAKGTLKLFGLRAYTLRDETGEIPVVTQSDLPAENSEIAIRGVVKSAVIVGGASLGLRVEESKRLR